MLGHEATGWLGSLVVAFIGAWAILVIVKRTGTKGATGSRSAAATPVGSLLIVGAHG